MMFSDISESYDLGNDILTLGMHRLWKRRLVRLVEPTSDHSILDLATGTGDIAFKLKKRAGKGAEVTGVDFSPGMISIAKTRSAATGISFEVGDTMNLRFPDDSFDRATISYGIRNVDDPSVALEEIHRVLRPGGLFGVLETGRASGLWGTLTNIYSEKFVPFLGGLVSGNPDAYHYLNESASQFPYGPAFVELMDRAGFQHVRSIPLVGGISYIYIGEVA